MFGSWAKHSQVLKFHFFILIANTNRDTHNPLEQETRLQCTVMFFINKFVINAKETDFFKYKWVFNPQVIVIN